MTLTRLARFAIALVLFSNPWNTKASHFGTAEIDARFIGISANDLTYEVTLKQYQLCGQAVTGFSNYQIIKVSSRDSNFYFNDTSGYWLEDRLNYACKSGQGDPMVSCAFQTLTGIVYIRRTYIFNVTVPKASEDLVFSWRDGLRLSDLNNLNQPSDQWIYIACGVNNVARYNNSSPRYTVSPVLVYPCVNERNYFWNFPSGNYGDSLVTTNQQPKTDSNQMANYATGYSLLNPVGSLNGYTVDPGNGTISYTPASTGSYAVSMRTDAFDPATGKNMGFVIRDVVLFVQPCTGTFSLPVFDTANINLAGGMLNTAHELLCYANQPVSFNLKAGVLPARKIFGSLNSPIPPSSTVGVTNPSADSVSFQFNWTPTLSDEGRHLLVFKAVDTTCMPGELRQTTYHHIWLNVKLTVDSMASSPNDYEDPGPANAASMSVSVLNKNQINVYPNPANDKLNINAANKKIISFEIFNTVGQKIISSSLSTDGTINVSQLLPGYYLLKMLSNDEIYLTNFLKY